MSSPRSKAQTNGDAQCKPAPMTRRVSFLIKHLIADIFFYRIPRLVTLFLVRIPRAIWRFITRAPQVDERAYTLVYNHASQPGKPSAAVLFGIAQNNTTQHTAPAHHLPTLRYEGPLYSGHLHTMLGGLRVSDQVQYERELVEGAGGQHVHMDYLLPKADGEAPRGMLFIIPGLLNSSTTNSVRHFAQMAAEHYHFGVCVLNYRGMGSTPLETPRLFSATFTDDIRCCLAKHLTPEKVKSLLKTKEPVPVIGVGFSLGGITLIKYISEQGKNGEACPLNACFAVTSPFDLVESDRQTCKWPYRLLYEKPFAAGLRKYVKHNRAVLEKLPNVDAEKLFSGPSPVINKMTSIHLFDEWINASHNGFAKVHDYYRAADSLPWLQYTQTPVMCLYNYGDPVAGHPIPAEEWQAVADKNANVAYICTPCGGHLGYLGSPLAEWRQSANVMERLVLDCATQYCDISAEL